MRGMGQMISSIQVPSRYGIYEVNDAAIAQRLAQKKRYPGTYLGTQETYGYWPYTVPCAWTSRYLRALPSTVRWEHGRNLGVAQWETAATVVGGPPKRRPLPLLPQHPAAIRPPAGRPSSLLPLT